jgi:hypothetical protein
MSISKLFQHFHQEDLGRKVDEIIDAVNSTCLRFITFYQDEQQPTSLTYVNKIITNDFSHDYLYTLTIGSILYTNETQICKIIAVIDISDGLDITSQCTIDEDKINLPASSANHRIYSEYIAIV